MADASGDYLDDRLWSTASVPVAVELRSCQVDDGMFTIEFDEKAGWVSNGTAIEVTDPLTNSWQHLPPDAMEQLDRFLDLETYRVGFPTDPGHRFSVVANKKAGAGA